MSDVLNSVRLVPAIEADGAWVTSAEQRLAELYESKAAASLRLAYLMTRDSDLSEDIVQEAFIRCFAMLKDRGSPDRLDAYLRRTIVNLSHDRHRKLRTERARAARFQRKRVEASNPDARMAFGELLRDLPHRQRAALVLRYYEDLSEQDAAHILGCSVGALKQLVQRALNTLRRTDDR